MEPISAAIAAIPALVQLGAGIHQGITANKLSKTPRPERKIPQSIQDAVALAQGRVNDTRLPGQSRMEDALGQTTATSVRQIGEMSGGDHYAKLAAASGAFSRQNKQLQDIGIRASAQQLQDIQVMMGMLGQQGQQEVANWEWNRRDPYLNAMDAAAKMKTASLQNAYGGISGISNAAVLGIGGAGATGGSDTFYGTNYTDEEIAAITKFMNANSNRQMGAVMGNNRMATGNE